MANLQHLRKKRRNRRQRPHDSLPKRLLSYFPKISPPFDFGASPHANGYLNVSLSDTNEEIAQTLSKEKSTGSFTYRIYSDPVV